LKHVIDEFLAFLTKLLEIWGPQQNPQIQLIKSEPHGEEHIFSFITQEYVVTGEDRMTQGKATEESGVRKVAEKTQTFDAKKEKQMFEERREFREDQGSSSNK
jgi:hypothetical protein